jgi:release factor glutamine methyltransferase
VKVAQALREAAERLAQVSDTAWLDAELLMAEALGVARSELLLRHMDGPVPDGFAAMVERRARHEPVAYIIGRQEFFGREFVVTPDVLIPRADSETIVQAALDVCSDPVRVLDCGVGSGALLLTVLAERPGAKGVGTDRSTGAIELASANAGRFGLASRCELLLRDWTRPGWADGLGQFDLILANPPYVESGAELAPSVRDFEPHGALYSGADGLDDYRILIPQFPKLLTEEGIAVVEIGAGQAEMVAEITRKAGFSAQLHKDLAGRPRALVLQLSLGNGGVRR